MNHLSNSRNDRVGDLSSLGVGDPLPAGDGALAPVDELVATIARNDPNRPAITAGDQTLTYGQLMTWADIIRARLLDIGVRRHDRIGVLVEPSAAMVAAVLGILRAGAAYVPIDHAQPVSRMTLVARDAELSAVVVDRHREQLTGLGPPLVSASAADDSLLASSFPEAPGGGRSDAAAYLTYTSGTTGEPKGVVVVHASLAASTFARRVVYPGPSTFLLVSPLAFDSSAAGLWGTLTGGGHLVVAATDEARDPERLVGLIADHSVTQLLCVPSLYSAVLDAVERAEPRSVDSLETVIVAGEPLVDAVVARHFAIHDRVALVNEYGPTEGTVWATYCELDAPGPVSIGRPIPGGRIYVLDANLQPVPRGRDGELFVGGPGVAQGYFRRHDATRRAFLVDPFSPEPDARMYRTGDIARWNDDDTLHFVGRIDDQVKIRGHRIELGAVEAALGDLPDVLAAVVVPSASRTNLWAFVITRPGAEPERLRSQVAEHLPTVMVPSRITAVEKFPLMASGKIDRRGLTRLAEDSRLPPHSGVGITLSGSFIPTTASSSDVTAQVAAAWSQVLSIANVPTDTNFFDLGGHSLTMFELQDALEQHTGTRPAVVSLFRHSTVAAQAAFIGTGGASVTERESTRDIAARRAQAIRNRRQRIDKETTS